MIELEVTPMGSLVIGAGRESFLLQTAMSNGSRMGWTCVGIVPLVG